MTARILEVSRHVRASAERCFSTFTEDVDGWWRRGPRFRRWRDSVVSFERKRLWERRGDEAAVVADVIEWSPPNLLVLSMRGERVEVAFQSVEDGTRVVVRHHRDDDLTHFQDAKGLWWSDLLVSWALGVAQ